MTWKRLKAILLPPEPPMPPPPAHIPMPAIPGLGEMTREKFLGNPQNVTALRNAFEASPVLKDWLRVAWSEIPRNYPNRGEPVNDTMAAVALGEFKGYFLCLDVLQSCLVYRREAGTNPPMTFPKSIEDTYNPKRK